MSVVQSIEHLGGKIYNATHPLHKAISGPAIQTQKSYDFYIRGTGLMGWTYPDTSKILAFFRGRLNGTVNVTNISHDPFSSSFVITLTPLKPIAPQQIAKMLVNLMYSYAGIIGHLGSFAVTDWEIHGTIKNGFASGGWEAAAIGAGLIFGALLLLRGRL